jgi:uncharacterized membrane protein
MKYKTILLIILILGMLDSGYLTVTHFVPSALKCPLAGGVVDCGLVTTSVYSEVFGIPIAILGLVWFVACILFAIFGYNKIIKNIWMLFGVGAIIYSGTTQSILGKICIYCVALDTLIALTVFMFVYWDRKK